MIRKKANIHVTITRNKLVIENKIDEKNIIKAFKT
jgi:hypothetical protein